MATLSAKPLIASAAVFDKMQRRLLRGASRLFEHGYHVIHLVEAHMVPDAFHEQHAIPRLRRIE
jgi:hypothetical protein